MAKKLSIIIMLLFIFILSSNKIFSEIADNEMRRIFFAIEEELQLYRRYPQNGWLQIYRDLIDKHKIVIPVKYMEEVQKFYIRKVLSKMLDINLKSFEEFEKIHPIPLGIRNYTRDYFNNVYLKDAADLVSSPTEKTPVISENNIINKEPDKNAEIVETPVSPERKYSLPKIDYDELAKIFLSHREQVPVSEGIQQESDNFSEQAKQALNELKTNVFENSNEEKSDNSLDESAIKETRALKESLLRTQKNVVILTNLLENALKHIEEAEEDKDKVQLKEENELLKKDLKIYASITKEITVLVNSFISQTMDVSIFMPETMQELNTLLNHISRHLNSVSEELLLLRNQNRVLLSEKESLEEENRQLRSRVESLGLKIERSRMYDMQLRNLGE